MLDDAPLRPQTDVRATVSVTAVLIIGAVSIVAALGADSVAAIVFGLCFGVALLVVAAVAVATRTRVERLTDIDATVVDGVRVTRIHYSSRIFWLLGAAMASSMLFSAGTTVALWMHGGPSIPSSASLVCTALLASYLVAVARGRVRRGCVTLGADGIRHRGWSFDAFVPWESVRGMGDRFGAHSSVIVFADPGATVERRYTTWLWHIDRLPSDTAIVIPCGQFALSQGRLHRVIAHYVENSDFRNELGTVLSLSRAKAAALPYDPKPPSGTSRR